MARRRSMKKKTTRRRKQGINLVNLAQSAVIANATTKGLFGASLPEFITGRMRANGFQFRPGGDGFSVITLPELLGFRSGSWSLSGVGGNYGTGKTFLDGVAYNFDKQGLQMIGTLIAAPIAFKLGTKLTAKPRRDANKLLKMAGLSTVVKV